MACVEMPQTVKEELLRELSLIPVALQETADKQTRLRRGNGKRDGDGGNGSEDYPCRFGNQLGDSTYWKTTQAGQD